MDERTQPEASSSRDTSTGEVGCCLDCCFGWLSSGSKRARPQQGKADFVLGPHERTEEDGDIALSNNQTQLYNVLPPNTMSGVPSSEASHADLSPIPRLLLSKANDSDTMGMPLPVLSPTAHAGHSGSAAPAAPPRIHTVGWVSSPDAKALRNDHVNGEERPSNFRNSLSLREFGGPISPFSFAVDDGNKTFQSSTLALKSASSLSSHSQGEMRSTLRFLDDTEQSTPGIADDNERIRSIITSIDLPEQSASQQQQAAGPSTTNVSTTKSVLTPTKEAEGDEEDADDAQATSEAATTPSLTEYGVFEFSPDLHQPSEQNPLTQLVLATTNSSSTSIPSVQYAYQTLQQSLAPQMQETPSLHKGERADMQTVVHVVNVPLSIVSQESNSSIANNRQDAKVQTPRSHAIEDSLRRNGYRPELDEYKPPLDTHLPEMTAYAPDINAYTPEGNAYTPEVEGYRLVDARTMHADDTTQPESIQESYSFTPSLNSPWRALNASERTANKARRALFLCMTPIQTEDPRPLFKHMDKHVRPGAIAEFFGFKSLAVDEWSNGSMSYHMGAPEGLQVDASDVVVGDEHAYTQADQLSNKSAARLHTSNDNSHMSIQGSHSHSHTSTLLRSSHTLTHSSNSHTLAQGSHLGGWPDLDKHDKNRRRQSVESAVVPAEADASTAPTVPLFRQNYLNYYGATRGPVHVATKHTPSAAQSITHGRNVVNLTDLAGESRQGLAGVVSVSTDGSAGVAWSKRESTGARRRTVALDWDARHPTLATAGNGVELRQASAGYELRQATAGYGAELRQEVKTMERGVRPLRDWGHTHTHTHTHTHSIALSGNAHQVGNVRQAGHGGNEGNIRQVGNGGNGGNLRQVGNGENGGNVRQMGNMGNGGNVLQQKSSNVKMSVMWA